MNNVVQQFEKAFTEYVGAKFAIAMCNGTATLHTALVALGVKGDRWEDASEGIDAEYHLSPDSVAVPPLTMASTTIAVLHAGGRPVFVDVDPDTWLMEWDGRYMENTSPEYAAVTIPVSLYGLQTDWGGEGTIIDAAQTLHGHGNSQSRTTAFTSYSFQASKILPLGEGGMLVTDHEDLACKARQFSSLGYQMHPDQPRIDSAILKSPDFARHYDVLGWNYRMADAVAEKGLEYCSYGQIITNPLARPDIAKDQPVMNILLSRRRDAAEFYSQAVYGCPWITPQHVPEGWTHDYWCYAVALESAEMWHPFVEAIERYGGERPYACWRITYQEPAFRHLAEDGTCPVAEDLQPRLVQMQTNSIEAACTNADAVAKAIQEIDG